MTADAAHVHDWQRWADGDDHLVCDCGAVLTPTVQAHVAAVAEAFLRADWKRRYREQLATLAVETLTPLIRAQVAAEIRAERAKYHERTPSWLCFTDAARIAEGAP